MIRENVSKLTTADEYGSGSPYGVIALDYEVG